MLPPRPSLEQVRKRAKELRDLVRTGQAKFTSIALRYHPDPPVSWPAFTLADAQLVLARHYGFASWRRLRSHLDLVARHARSPQRLPAAADPPADGFLRHACLIYRPSWKALAGEDADGPHRHAAALSLLASTPELGKASIHTAAATGDAEAVRSFSKQTRRKQIARAARTPGHRCSISPCRDWTWAIPLPQRGFCSTTGPIPTPVTCPTASRRR